MDPIKGNYQSDGTRCVTVKAKLIPRARLYLQKQEDDGRRLEYCRTYESNKIRQKRYYLVNENAFCSISIGDL